VQQQIIHTQNIQPNLTNPLNNNLLLSNYSLRVIQLFPFNDKMTLHNK